MSEKMSNTFLEAFGLYNYNKDEAIRLYDIELKNNPTNTAALNNIGLCKLDLAIKNKSKELLEESKKDFRKGISLLGTINSSLPTSLEGNLKIAEETIID
jgi:hypothetical protein